MKTAVCVCWPVLVFYLFIVLAFQDKSHGCVHPVIYYSVCLSPLFAFFLLGLLTRLVYNNENATDDPKSKGQQDSTHRSRD